MSDVPWGLVLSVIAVALSAFSVGYSFGERSKDD